MEARSKIVLIVLVALVPLGMWAQEPEPQQQEDQPILPPVTLNGRGPSLAFQSEKRRNYLSGGLDFTSTFTDNAFLSSTDQTKSLGYLIGPRLAFSQSTPRLNWDLGVGAVLIQDQAIRQSQQEEDLTMDLSGRLTQHVDLRLSDTFTNTLGFFYILNPTPLGSGIGAVQQSNNSLLVPLFQRTLAEESLVESSYQFSPNSAIGVRGTYSIHDYPRSSRNVQFRPLNDSRAYSAEAFYNYRMSAKQWVGVGLRGQRFETKPSGENTDVGSLLLYYGVNATPNVTLSFFAGPEYFDLPQNSSAATTGRFPGPWTSAEGATLNWQGAHASAAAGFARELSDSGGFSSAVTLQTAYAQLRCLLGSDQEVNFSLTYAQNNPLEFGGSFSGLSATVQFRRRLATNLTAGVGYARQQQELPGSQGTANANLAWVFVSYNFVRPLGR
jgi:hypothetical protein